ncbi:MAG: PspC domain-containing protein [Rhodoferax sp.]|nr:PspC domain-containing protein [Rhodoferax sp.]
MSLVNDLTHLEQMHARGALSAQEYERAKQRLLSPQPTGNSVVQSLNGLRRASADRWIGGVCGGLATATGLGTWLWRLAFTLLLLLGGTGLVAYLLLWLFVPLDSGGSQQTLLS